MPVDKFSIGIENEGFWRGKADYDLPANYKDPKTFAHLIARLYKNVHEDHQDLHPDFTKESHPGHGNPEKWLVCTDDAIGSSDNLLGGEGKDEKWPEGCTYSTTLCGVTIAISLTTIQIGLNLLLEY